VTQVISFVSPRYICQASDLLVSSTTSGKAIAPYDPKFSKNVIFVAKDALVSIGFTGLAYLRGRPTDEWIASVLAGESLEAHGNRGFGTRIRTEAGRYYPANWPDIGFALERLRSACALAFADLRRRGQQRELAAGLFMSVVGWQWKWHWQHRTARSHHLRPIICRLIHDQVLGGFALERIGRYWGWETGQSRLEAVPRMPPEVLNGVVAATLKAQHPLKDSDIENALVDAIRNIAKEPQRGVSADCLSLSMWPYGDPMVRIRYNALPVTNAKSGQTGVLPASYTGWIVSPTVIQAPQIMALSAGMNVRAQAEWVSIEYEGPRSISAVSGMGTRPRRPPP
jgi:hypothetical protein